VQIHLVDTNEELVAAWRSAFGRASDVHVDSGSILNHQADAIVSPANSFGFMDGGIDLAYSGYFGWHVQDALQTNIKASCHGELPVGQALVVETGHPGIPFLISAPTMRVPADVSATVNAYLAFRAALIAASVHNQSASRQIGSILVPGLGTGVGRLSAEACATQMFAAYIAVFRPWFPVRLGEAAETHWLLVQRPKPRHGT
jgi:O-acetyl-ADP-ribose deacetylase (regulator of RNase III)